jgi:hypothetical protein
MHKYFYGNWKAKFPKNLHKGKCPKLSALFRLSGSDLTLAQPPQHQQKWNQ